MKKTTIQHLLYLLLAMCLCVTHPVSLSFDFLITTSTDRSFDPSVNQMCWRLHKADSHQTLNPVTRITCPPLHHMCLPCDLWHISAQLPLSLAPQPCLPFRSQSSSWVSLLFPDCPWGQWPFWGHGVLLMDFRGSPACTMCGSHL